MHSHQCSAFLFLLYITTISCDKADYIRKVESKKEEIKEVNSYRSIEREEVIYQSLHEKTFERFHEPLHLIEEYPEDMDVSWEIDNGKSRHNKNKNTTKPDRRLQSENKPLISKIIGGDIVPDQNRYPYMASILNSRRSYNGGIRVWHVCGGSLIKPNIVLGAAHCAGSIADYIQLGKRHVSGGTTIEELDQIETYTIIDQVFHPEWDRKLFYRDMVLYKLDSKSTKLPIKISQSNQDGFYDEPNKKSRILGWGKTENDGLPSAYLREADVSYIPHDECVGHKYLYGNIVKEDAMMCFAEEGKDACQGDSGGPLVQVDAYRSHDPAYDVQMGVISWGVDCAHKRYPGVYAKLDYDWIEHAICNSLDGLAPEECYDGKLYDPKNEYTGDEIPTDPGVTGDMETLDLCKDSTDSFQESWDNYVWDCGRVAHWWWYACMYYSSHCPEACCGDGNCNPDTGECIFGYF